METNVRCTGSLRVFLYGGWGEVTSFLDILGTISRRVYELEAVFRSGVCAAGCSFAGFDKGGRTDDHHWRHSRRGHGPERRDRSWRKSRSEGRNEGQHARVHDEQGRRVPLLLAVAWPVHDNGDCDGLSVV